MPGPRLLVLAALCAGLAAPATAQEAQQKPIRNAPSPRAMTLVSYIYAASNVCGYRIGAPEFAALMATYNLKPEDVGARGPFGQRIAGMFTMMSNQIAQNREQACIAVADEYGPTGSIARNVLQPGDPSAPPSGTDQGAPGAAEPAKP